MTARTKGGRVVVVGSVNHDVVVRTGRLPQPGETLAAHNLDRYAGGKGANHAAAAARAGAVVQLVAAVGRDRAGDVLLAASRDQGVHIDAVRRITERPTGSAMVTVTDAGRIRFSCLPARTQR